MKHRLATQTADAGLLEHALIALDPRRLALPIDDLRHAPAFNAVGTVDVGDRLQQPLAFLLRHARQHTSIGGDRFEQLDRLAQALARQLVGGGGIEQANSTTKVTSSP